MSSLFRQMHRSDVYYDIGPSDESAYYRKLCLYETYLIVNSDVFRDCLDDYAEDHKFDRHIAVIKEILRLTNE